MPQNDPEQFAQNEKEKRRKRKNFLTRELIDNQVKIDFPGIDHINYQKLKADDEEFPGFVTPIDDLIERMEVEGIRVVFGTNTESGNMVFVPYKSDDIKCDSVLPQHLIITDDMDERIKELIVLSRIK